MDSNGGYHNLLRSRHVWRWSIVSTNRRQNVAEHSYLTWVIGMELFNRFYQKHNTMEQAAFGHYLLTHDAEEAITGDIPSPTKAILEQLSPGITRQLVERMTGAKKSLGYEHHVLGVLAKCADLIEAWMFLANEGNSPRVRDLQTAAVEQTVTQAMARWPDENWGVITTVFSEIMSCYND